RGSAELCQGEPPARGQGRLLRWSRTQPRAGQPARRPRIPRSAACKGSRCHEGKPPPGGLPLHRSAGQGRAHCRCTPREAGRHSRFVKPEHHPIKPAHRPSPKQEGLATMAKLTTDELIEAFKELTLIELSEFVKKFEEEFDVEAAAPAAAVAVAPAAGGGEEPAEEQTEFDVILESAGEKKVPV